MATLAGLPYTFNQSHSGNYGSVRALSTIKYIVLHYTANNGDTATGNGSYFARTRVGAGAHYFVDKTQVCQSIKDNYIAYHCQTAGMPLKCGCRNSNSIGIEMCSIKVNGQYVIPEETKRNAAALTKYLMKKYNIPASNVIRHYDVCGKTCPEPWVRLTSEWNSFKSMLVETPKPVETVKEDDEVIETGVIVKDGKSYKIDKINKDGKNFISLSELANLGFEIGYDAPTKNMILNTKVGNIKVDVDGEEKNLSTVNIAGNNFAKLRDVADVTGAFGVDYVNGKVVINTKED